MPKIRQNATPVVSCQDRAKAETDTAALEHDHRGDEGEPGPQEQVEEDQGERTEHEQQDRPGLGVTDRHQPGEREPESTTDDEQDGPDEGDGHRARDGREGGAWCRPRSRRCPPCGRSRPGR